MESCFNKGNSSVRGWKNDYDNLKHVRWIRNQLAHEVSYYSDICSFDDYEWLDNFYKRLFSSDDPLGALRKMEMKATVEHAGKRQTDNGTQQAPRVVYPPPQIMQQRPTVNQSSGCLSTFMMMLILSVSIIFSLFILL